MIFNPKSIYFGPHFDSGWKMKPFELSHDSKSDAASYMLPTKLTFRAIKQYLNSLERVKQTIFPSSFPFAQYSFRMGKFLGMEKFKECSSSQLEKKGLWKLLALCVSNLEDKVIQKSKSQAREDWWCACSIMSILVEANPWSASVVRSLHFKAMLLLVEHQEYIFQQQVGQV